MKLKKLLSALAVSSVFAMGAAQAAPVVVDVNQWDPTPAGGTDGKTAPISFFALNWTAKSTYTDNTTNPYGNVGSLGVGDFVVDSGKGTVGYLDAGNATLFGPENNEGFGFTHAMVFDYAGLSGVVAAIDPADPGGIGAIYSSGTINLRGDTNADGIGDVLLMTLGVIGSTGTIGNFSLFTKVTSVAPDVFFLNGVTDFDDLLVNLQVIVGEANFNNKGAAPGQTSTSPLQWERTSKLNGNLQFSVPEPGALALLGLGLAGLGLARRSKKQAS